MRALRSRMLGVVMLALASSCALPPLAVQGKRCSKQLPCPSPFQCVIAPQSTDGQCHGPCQRDLNEVGLLAHWAFDDGSGDIAMDSSCNGLVGALQGDPHWTKGRKGGALEFDGVDDYVSVEGRLAGGRSTFTFCAWFRTVASDKVPVYNEYNSSGAGQLYFNINEDPNGKIELGMLNGSGGYAGVSLEDAGVTDGLWHHVAVVQSSNSDRALFLDGSSRASRTTPGFPLTLDRVSIGSRQADKISPRYFRGDLDEVRVYDRALSSAEITGLVSAK